MPRAIGQKSFSRPLLAWYDRHQRDLPWRAALPNPYHVLLSEFMLQQTQVATVIPYFHRFLKAFPTLRSLAAAPQQSLLRLWQGLGYYSRARNLHAAAQKIVKEYDSQIPRDANALMNLPGIGRYTAGAIASIAFSKREPILDGNVARVLCRLDAIKTDPRRPKTKARLWKTAKEILPLRRPGDFNSALMELGATICTPRNPRCDICPISRHCKARAANLVTQIPLQKKAKPTPLNQRWTFAVNHRNRWLIEQRPPRGRWPGLWQFITIPAAGEMNNPSEHLGFAVDNVRPLGRIKHALTHRRYEFSAFSCRIAKPRPGTWVTLKNLSRYPLPKPHVLIAKLLDRTVESTP